MRHLTLLVLSALAAAESPYSTLDLPAAGKKPDAWRDASGALNAVWVEGDAVMFARCDGSKWTAAVKLGAGAVTAGECGPRVAAAGRDVLGAVWQTRGAMTVAVSRDGGKTWKELAPPAASGRPNVPAIAGDGDGTLVLAWVDLGTLGGEDTCDMVVSRLAPDASQWSAPARLGDEPGAICPCCAPATASDGKGRVLLACRGAQGGVREIVLFESTDAGATWKKTQVSKDRWELNTCPESGPALAVSPDGGTVAVAWRHASHLRWAVARSGVWASGAALDAGVTEEDFVRAGADDSGRAVFGWTSDHEVKFAAIPGGKLEAEKSKGGKAKGPFAMCGAQDRPILVAPR